MASYGADPRRLEYAGADLADINYAQKYNNCALQSRYDSLDAEYNLQQESDYVNGQSYCCTSDSPELQTEETEETEVAVEDNLYFYHPDHLGSTAMVTDVEGRITQNVAYIPFGEVFVEERDGNWNTPYLFNAKEMDSETGLYYYGARYLDPTAAMWMTVDPLFEKYPGMSPYNYCAGNPVKLVDPDGKSGKVHRDDNTHTITISAHLIFYGPCANIQIANKIANDIQRLWNDAKGVVTINDEQYNVVFCIDGVRANEGLLFSLYKSIDTNPYHNYIKISEYVDDGPIDGCSWYETSGNEGHFQLNQVDSDTETTAAHEFGHGLGLDHPNQNQKGKGQPGIMCNRGCYVDEKYRYNHNSTINPEKRKVIQSDIDNLRLDTLEYDSDGNSYLGE